MLAHLPALRAMLDYELTAVCTSRPETAAESAAHYGARLAFHDYHAMVRHPDVDLVVVSVRVPLHCSGCDVLFPVPLKHQSNSAWASMGMRLKRHKGAGYPRLS